MSAAREEYLTVSDGARLRCLVAGDGPATLLLVPGLTMTADVFAAQLASLSARGLRVVAYDPRGHGRSTKSLDGHSLTRRGRDLGEVAAAFGRTPLVVGSWSQGVLDHLSLVRRTGPQALAASILIDGTPRFLGDPAREWVWYGLGDQVAPEAQLARWIAGPLEDRAAYTALYTATLEDPTPARVEWLRALSEQTPAAIAALLGALGAVEDRSAELLACAADHPVLVIASEPNGAAARAWLADHAPAAELAVLGGHLMFLERADAFDEIVCGFLVRAGILGG